MLTAPKAGENLIMHLVASKESINAALFAKRSEGQIPIYLVSRVLQGAELNYHALEKLILVLVHAARRLQRYFQDHTIMVLTGLMLIDPVEYEALLAGLRIAQEMEITKVAIFLDSQLVGTKESDVKSSKTKHKANKLGMKKASQYQQEETWALKQEKKIE
nr:reverse transcriptase domain-containing protein [Tanacetum cinerariifolium]